MLGKVWFTRKHFVNSTAWDCAWQKSGQSIKELELPLRKVVSWASHFDNIFMESSVMADILNRSNFYFTFSFHLGIRVLFVCLLFFRMKTICVSNNKMDILLQFSRLIDD